MNQLLIIVSNGLNEQQHLFIEQLCEAGSYDVEFIPYDNNDFESEVSACKTIFEKGKKFENKSNQRPTILFAVDEGNYIIPEIVKELGEEQVIHIDHTGTRFGFANPINKHIQN